MHLLPSGGLAEVRRPQVVTIIPLSSLWGILGLKSVQLSSLWPYLGVKSLEPSSLWPDLGVRSLELSSLWGIEGPAYSITPWRSRLNASHTQFANFGKVLAWNCLLLIPTPLLIATPGPVGGPLGAIDFLHVYNSDVVQNRRKTKFELISSFSWFQTPVSYRGAIVQWYIIQLRRIDIQFQLFSSPCVVQ